MKSLIFMVSIYHISSKNGGNQNEKYISCVFY